MVKRLLLALAVFSLLLSAPKAQAQECISGEKLRLFSRAFLGKDICVHVKYFKIAPLDKYDGQNVGSIYLNSFANMTIIDAAYEISHYFLVPITGYERVSQIKMGDRITVYGCVVKVIEYYSRPMAVVEVNRIDHGGERLQLDLKLRGKE